MNDMHNLLRRRFQPTDLDTLHPINPPEWFSGWWHAAPTFFIIGLGAGVILSRYLP